MIFVTGATGFLGSHICRKLLKEGYDVVGLKRSSSSLTLVDDIKDNMEWVEGDILQPDSIDQLLSRVDTIIHTAAVVSFHSADFEKMDQINVEGTKNMVNLALKHNVNRFIHISSVAALGRNLAQGTINETNKWQESKYNTHYGQSKYHAELEVWRGMVEGLNAVILNPSVILGPGDWENSSSSIFKYVWNESKFYSEGYINYVDVRDVVDIIHKILNDESKFGERYIVNAGSETFKAIFEKIAERFGKKPPTVKATSFLVKIGLFIESVKYILTGRKPLITREIARVGGARIYFDNNKAVTELNHTFVPLSQTLDWACAYYLENKK